MSRYDRGPAPKRSGSVQPRAANYPKPEVVEKPRPFELSPIDKILIQACKQITGIVLCGGWVRDKMLGAKPKDYDLIVSHEKYEDFKAKIGPIVKELAVKEGYRFEDLSEPALKRVRTGTKPLRCGFDFICYKFRLTNTATGESTDMEIDAKQLYPGQEFTSDIERRDYSVNCLLYSIKNDAIIYREKDLVDLNHKRLHPAVGLLETMKDPVRFLRAFRLKHEKGLQFSQELESYLRTDKGESFSGYRFRTISHHAKKASPLEYKKIINQSPVLHACIAEIYEYGYIFRWRTSGSKTRMSDKAAILSRELNNQLNSQFSQMRNWTGWQQHEQAEYFARAFLVALAVFELDKMPAAERELDLVANTEFYLLMKSFIPEIYHEELSGFLSKLAEDYKQGVPELSGLREYRRAFRHDFSPEPADLKDTEPGKTDPLVPIQQILDNSNDLDDEFSSYDNTNHDWDEDKEDFDVDGYGWDYGYENMPAHILQGMSEYDYELTADDLKWV